MQPDQPNQPGVQEKINVLTIGDKQYKETDLSSEIIDSIKHILILQNKNKELSTDFAINQNTIKILENNLKVSLQDIPEVHLKPEDSSEPKEPKESQESKA